MQLTITKRVFNPELKGKAVRITGHDLQGRYWNNVYLVSGINDDRIGLIDHEAKIFTLTLKDFEVSVNLKLEVWEDEE